MSVYILAPGPIQVIQSDEKPTVPEGFELQELAFTPKTVKIHPDIDRRMRELAQQNPGPVAELLQEISQLETEKERVYLLGEQTCKIHKVSAEAGLFGFQISQNGLDTYVMTSDDNIYQKFVNHIR